MAFDYKPLFKQLIDKDISREQLKNDLQLSPATMAKMSKGENVALTVLDKICVYLDCEVEDVIQHIKEN